MADPKPPGATAQGSHRADALWTPTPRPQLSLWAGQWLARPGQGEGLVTTGTGPAGAFGTGVLCGGDRRVGKFPHEQESSQSSRRVWKSKLYNQDNKAVNPCYCGQLLPWLGGAGVRGMGCVAWVLTS